MNWQIFGLMTYGFGLAMILIVLAFALFSRGQKHQPSQENQQMQKKPDFQQIERLVRLHQDVKDDLAHYGDVLVALRNEQLTTQSHLQRQIDVCLQYIQNEQEKQRINTAHQKGRSEAKQAAEETRTTAEMRQEETSHQAALQESMKKNEREPGPQDDHGPSNRAGTTTGGSENKQKQTVKQQEDVKEQARKLLRYGMEPDMISRKTGLSRGEIELISSFLQDSTEKE